MPSHPPPPEASPEPPPIHQDGDAGDCRCRLEPAAEATELEPALADDEYVPV